ncbi:Uncharacterised protein [Mycobacteroides abscessus subsp. abscessus]|nr:Uncharacterised protein [Mycobacteroides abscessus subsp. abscessus]
MADEAFAHVACLVLGAGHQNGPAVECARLPPGELAALADDLADREDQRSAQRVALLVERGQRRLDGALRAGGAVDRDRNGRLWGETVLGQCAGGLGQMTRRRVQHQRPRCCGERGPVDAFGADVGLGVARAQRHARIARDHGSRRQSWQHLECDRGARDGVDLGQHRIGRQRITGDDADDVVALLRRGDEGASDLSGIAECGMDDLILLLDGVVRSGRRVVGLVLVGGLVGLLRVVLGALTRGFRELLPVGGADHRHDGCWNVGIDEGGRRIRDHCPRTHG